MDRIYTKRAFAFVSILIMLFSLAVNVFAISEQGLPGEVGDMFGMDDTSAERVMPRDAGDNTTDLPDGDHTTERAPQTTRAAASTTSPTTTGNVVENAATTMGGAWIILLLVLLVAVIVIIIAVVTKKK